MRFGILGEVEARRADGSLVALGGPKVRVLLTLLLADAPRVVSTDRLIDGLYGSSPPEGGANALQAQVSRLRRSLGGLVERTAFGYRLDVSPADIDAHVFESLLSEGRPGEALALWRGSPPVELGEAYLSRLEELRLRALEADIEGSLGPASVPRLQELVAAHPLRERFRGQLMRALAAGGRQAEALTAFEQARQTLAEELGADPSAELSGTHVAILKSEAITLTPPPAQLTSFVGRDDDLAQVTALLERHRLVTLTGPGGTGKTRLAVEVSRDFEVCFVELAKSSDVAQGVLTALGLRESRTVTAPPAERIAAALDSRPLLLVFDNCEHVIEDAAQLAGYLLAQRPELRILATSREPLAITGEALYPVPRLTPSLAVRLFNDRATAVRGSFAEDVAHICEALDGLPLAIELAAARVRSLSVKDIAARLDDRFTLLSKGSRTAEERHRTLRGVVEWSWDLLSASERTLAARLTVFAGGATLADAEAVSGLPGEVLESLVDKSLVEIVGDRYRMLETIRAFCAERLDSPEIRLRHARHFLEFAAHATSFLLGSEQLEWLDRLEAEHDNLHAALRFAVDSDPDLALRLVGALSPYWWMRGRRFEGARLCLELAEKLGPALPEGRGEEYVLCVVNALGAKGEEPLRAHLSMIHAWGRARQAPPKNPFTTVVVAPAVGPPSTEDAAKLIGSDQWSTALEPLGRSFYESFAGDVNAAYHSLNEALDRFRALGERWGSMQCLMELSVIVSWRGDHARAISLLDEAIRLVGDLGSTDELGELIIRRADCLMRSGDPAAAAQEYHRVETLAVRLATPGLLVGAHLGQATLARRRGDLGEARRLCLLARDECGSGWFGPDWTRSRILVALGWVACAEKKADEAAEWFGQALADAGRWDNSALRAAVTEGLAAVALLEDDPARAARLLGTATRLRGMAVAGDTDVGAVSSAATVRIGPDQFSHNYQAGLAG
ncbi:BTAD domain-containing putative transcriptional regulator [Actinocrispum sp. NPDC049592]|uniref:BTAD domain-containing putative transcriptional regulator n=1 Tax=Actinocrispum sp. NPDC049592 TaxID=3154835 RepID=UPI0034413E8B